MQATEDKIWLENFLLLRYLRKVEEDVNLHKWFQSEKQGQDVGWDSALVDWTIRIAERFYREHPVP